MPPAKRKAEGQAHESRLEYDQAQEVDDGQNGVGRWAEAGQRASASTLASRRTVSATGTAGGGHGTKRYRRENYLRDMTELNRKFAKFAEKQMTKLNAELAARSPDEFKQGPPRFYLDACQQYMADAAGIKDKYMPEIGDILTCGAGEVGQLGWPEDDLNSAMTFYKPQLVKNLRNMGAGIIAISCGAQFNFALTDEGKVYSWGCNDEGALGQCDYTKEHPPKVDTSWSPAEIKGYLPSPAPPGTNFIDRPDEKIIAVATGDCHALSLGISGNVYFNGSYRDKEGRKWRDLPPSDDPRIKIEVNLRTAEEIEENKPPEQPPRGMHRWPIHVHQLPGKATKIACNASSNIVLMEDGSLMSWGMGESGEMCRKVPAARNEDGSYNLALIRDKLLKPTRVVFGGPDIRRDVLEIACGLYHTLVITRDYDGKSPWGSRAVYTCGANNYGQLGWGTVDEKKDGDTEPVVHHTLEKVEELDGKDIVKVAGGEHHSLALDITGKNLYAFGRDDSGQLGLTKTGKPDKYQLSSHPTPVFLVDGQDNPVISNIACGSFHSMITTADGDAYTWGFGENGALGHGRPARKEPIKERKEGEEEDISHVSKDETWPRKLDVMAGVRRLEAKEGKQSSGKAVVQMMDGGAQHSVILVTRKQGF